MTLLRITSCLALGLLLHTAGTANNIQVANATLTGNTGTSAKIQFDLSWENSWRGGVVSNWDAAWVFVKYRTSTTGDWQPVELSNTGHVAPTGSQVDLGLSFPGGVYNASTNPALGVFIYRNAVGTGNLALFNVQLQWNYSALGLVFNDVAQLQVFAIEMVYVPQGSFYLGAGGTEGGSFTDGSWISGASVPRQITAEDAITVGTGAGNLWVTTPPVGCSYATVPTGTLAAAFPKGYAAFYCMKYELSQQGYVEFLNSLTYTQQAVHTAQPPNSAAGTGALLSTLGTATAQRNGIDIQTPGTPSTIPAVYACNFDADGIYGEANDGMTIACNHISWYSMAAYLDWSGLRPMTELELEKACRGTLPPVPNEYAWGTNTIAGSAYTLSNPGAANEGIATNYSTTLGNAITPATGGGTIGGPIRGGIFAANVSSSGRVTAGASYYGIMELTSNLWETVVTIGNTQGRAFTGRHGSGAILGSGNANGVNWPDSSTGIGVGVHGGYFSSTPYTVCDRCYSTRAQDYRSADLGTRGVRTAP